MVGWIQIAVSVALLVLNIALPITGVAAVFVAIAALALMINGSMYVTHEELL